MRSVFVSTVFLVACAGATIAQEPGAMPPEQAAAIQRATPSSAHAALAKLAGEWTTTTTFSPAPGAPELESSGAATLTMTLEGRFLREEWKGEMMGQAASSSRTVGFNNGTGLYEAVWNYTLSTGMLIAIGRSADDGKTLQFQGTFDEGPQGGGITSLYMAMRIVSDDEFSWEIGDAAPGTERTGPLLVTTYKRKQ